MALVTAADALDNPEKAAGLGKDPASDQSLVDLLRWLRRWRKGELGRAMATRKAGGLSSPESTVWLWGEELWINALGDLAINDGRAGGRRNCEAEEIVAVQVVQEHRDGSYPEPVQEQVREWLEERLTGDKAKSTAAAYKAAWEKWCTWAKRQGWGTPFLSRTEDPVGRENKLLGYLGYMGWLGSSSATLKQIIFAVKDAHKRAGHGDPTNEMHRLWIVVNSLERNAVKRPRRLGVTVEMLRWLGKLMQEGEGDPGGVRVDCRMVTATMSLAWFFMLRAKEFCNSSGIDPEMILRGEDLMLRRDEQTGKATELTLQFRKSKTDQLCFGANKTMGLTGMDHVCVVTAVEKLAEVAPRRFKGGPESHQPLCKWSSGKVISRLEVQRMLQRAARAVGLPAERFQSHSLRIGGAVKRMGRWSSSAVQRYLHDDGDVLKGLARKMAGVAQRVHYT